MCPVSWFCLLCQNDSEIDVRELFMQLPCQMFLGFTNRHQNVDGRYEKEPKRKLNRNCDQNRRYCHQEELDDLVDGLVHDLLNFLDLANSPLRLIILPSFTLHCKPCAGQNREGPSDVSVIGTCVRSTP